MLAKKKSLSSTITAASTGAVSAASSKKDAVIVVDPISTGANVADAFRRSGLEVVVVKSTTQFELSQDPSLRSVETICFGHRSRSLRGLTSRSRSLFRTDYFSTHLFSSLSPLVTVLELQSLLTLNLVGVVVGSELGIECGDYLAEALKLPGNGTKGSDARRDKYLMQEAIRAKGIKAAKQGKASTWSEVESAVAEMEYPLIIKPVRSAGSDHIFKCHSFDDVRPAFDAIMTDSNALGEKNEAVVIQEFLAGTEYIVDSVSRDGVHKIVAIWEYDKRSHAGKEFVYFGMGSVSGKSEAGRQLAAYTLEVLDAIGIKEGAGHAEVIITKDGPCLVEIGARPQGCDGQ